MGQEGWGEEWGRTLQHITKQALLRAKAKRSSEMVRSSGVSWPAETRSLVLKLPLSVRCVSAANSKKLVIHDPIAHCPLAYVKIVKKKDDSPKSQMQSA